MYKHQQLVECAVPVEVCHNDGDGEGDAEHAADGAQRSDKLPGRGQRSNIAIACDVECGAASDLEL